VFVVERGGTTPADALRGVSGAAMAHWAIGLPSASRAHSNKIILLFVTLLLANVSIIRIGPDPLSSHTQVEQQT